MTRSFCPHKMDAGIGGKSHEQVSQSWASLQAYHEQAGAQRAEDLLHKVPQNSTSLEQVTLKSPVYRQLMKSSLARRSSRFSGFSNGKWQNSRGHANAWAGQQPGIPLVNASAYSRSSQCSPPCQPASHTELCNQCTLFPPRTSQPLTWRADRPRPLPLSIPTPASGSNTSTDLTDDIPDPRCSYGLFHTHHSFANEKLFDPALPANRFRTSFWLALVDGTVPKQEGLSLS